MLYGFSEYQKAQHGSSAGGKGCALARLFQKDYPVPDGFIIGADSFDNDGLRPELWDETMHRFQAMLASGVSAVAVRSSAFAEDSANTSFAGEFESVLHVQTTIELKDAIKIVFESSTSERVKSYSENLGTDNQHRMAVVVQQMVDADFAGVLFTVEPVTQNWNVLSGNFVKGLGEQLVSGEVTAEAFTIDRRSLQYQGDSALTEVAPILTELALKIEEEFGTPQDIEWAVKDGEVYILQSRPITTLSKPGEIWNSTLDGDYLWSNTNVGEAIGAVMTPYTWSLVRRSFDDFYEPPGQFSMLGNIGGRVYMNLSTLFGLLNRIWLRPKTLLSSAAPAIGLVPDDITLPVPKMTFTSAVKFVAKLIIKLVSASIRQQKHLAWAANESPDFCDEMLERVSGVSSLAHALHLRNEITEFRERDFGMLISVATEFAAKVERLKGQLTKHLSEDDVETLVSGLGGESILQSMGPMVSIERVARGEITRQEFIRTYGHRGPEEVELSRPRTAEDPAWMDKLIAQAREIDVQELLDKQEAARSAAWGRLADEVSPRRYNRLRKMADAAATAAQNRELVRSEIIRFVGVARELALKIGELAELGEDVFFLEFEEVEELLKDHDGHKEKILSRKIAFERYRRLPSLPNVISGTIDLETWEHNLNRRTDFYDSHKQLQIPDDDVIRGFPGAAGVVEGTVRVLAHHDEADLLKQGEILVASFTNVGWTPIFPKASAIITDIGAPLSHAAIVARELGIPSVVGTGNATMKLKTGDRVRVDGGAGIVEHL